MTVWKILDGGGNVSIEFSSRYELRKGDYVSDLVVREDLGLLFINTPDSIHVVDLSALTSDG